MITIKPEKANCGYKKAENNYGLCIPLNITHGINLHFAIENTDFRNDPPDGKSEFHGNTLTVSQKNVREIDRASYILTVHQKRKQNSKIMF